MILAIMSDTQDHIWNLRKALSMAKKNGAECIIHCGDFIAPFMLKELEQAHVPIHGVFGNNDGDQYTLTNLALTELSNISLYGQMGEIDCHGFQVAFTHYRTVAEGLAATGRFQLVCFGHTHQVCFEKFGDTVLLNPGEVMGKDGSPGFYLVNTSDGTYNETALPV
jgi:putative phosphoesterase